MAWPADANGLDAAGCATVMPAELAVSAALTSSLATAPRCSWSASCPPEPEASVLDVEPAAVESLRGPRDADGRLSPAHWQYLSGYVLVYSCPPESKALVLGVEPRAFVDRVTLKLDGQRLRAVVPQQTWPGKEILSHVFKLFVR